MAIVIDQARYQDRSILLAIGESCRAVLPLGTLAVGDVNSSRKSGELS